MELWIRTQNRRQLFKVSAVEYIYYQGTHCLNAHNTNESDNYDIGIYKSKERALEVMKEIEAGILYAGLPQREVEANLRNKDIKMQGNYEFNTITNVALYTMPEE